MPSSARYSASGLGAMPLGGGGRGGPGPGGGSGLCVMVEPAALAAALPGSPAALDSHCNGLASATSSPMATTPLRVAVGPIQSSPVHSQLRVAVGTLPPIAASPSPNPNPNPAPQAPV